MPQELKELSVPPSVQMLELLEEGHICKTVSRAFPDLQKILFQIQLDITNEENRDKIGPTILGLKHVHEMLLVFRAKGDLLIKQENQKDAKASK